MPKNTDSDLNRSEGNNIIFTSNDECPECDTLVEVEFDTGAKDEDGLTDVEADELTTEVTCSGCGHTWESTYSGWSNYGDAG